MSPAQRIIDTMMALMIRAPWRRFVRSASTRRVVLSWLSAATASAVVASRPCSTTRPWDPSTVLCVDHQSSMPRSSVLHHHHHQHRRRHWAERKPRRDAPTKLTDARGEEEHETLALRLSRSICRRRACTIHAPIELADARGWDRWERRSCTKPPSARSTPATSTKQARAPRATSTRTHRPVEPTRPCE